MMASALVLTTTANPGTAAFSSSGSTVGIQALGTDPGTGNAIPVTQSAAFALTIGAGAETNTLATPSFLGQLVTFSLNTIGAGSRTITTTSAFDSSGHIHAKIDGAGQSFGLIAVPEPALGVGIMKWQLFYNSGATLT
jgi:hypothetical protein